MKKIVSLLLLLVLTLSLAACDGNTQSSDENEIVDMQKVLAEITADSMPNDMKTLGSKEDLKKYYYIDEADVSDFAAIISADGGVNEIVLIKATDEAAAKRVEEKLQRRYDEKRNEGASYSPEHYEIMNKSKVAVKGQYVSMIACDDAPEMQKMFDSKISA